jgi:hypothetical protein
LGDFKHFRVFAKDFIRDQDYCSVCGKDMNRVILEKSDSKKLIVGCSDEVCAERYTIARKKG